MSDDATPLRVLGCDVAKDSVVIFDSVTGRYETAENSLKALRRALRRVGGQAFVVCEATGGYEAALLAAAGLEGVAAHRGDPRKISAFLRSLRSHGKTDPIDARGLARYGLERHGQLARWQPPNKAQQHLQQLVRLRADLVGNRADYTRRMKAPGEGPDKRHIRDFIKNCDQRIAAIEAEVDKIVATDTHLAQTTAIIKAIPGCGPVTAITLAAAMPELGQLSRRQAAALSGTAPHPRTSGNSDAYRSVRGGRQDVKTILFIAAMTARRHNPELRDFYERLRKNGKKPIVAIIAVARKLITIINAKIRDARYSKQKQLS